MTPRLLLCSLFAIAASAQQAVVLDFSGSMAGFAQGKASPLPGVLERLGYVMGASGAVQYYGMSARGQNRLDPLEQMTASRRFADRASFAGNTPLIWAIQDITGPKKVQDALFFTDGMEDGGQIERVAQTLSALAAQGWAVGLAAVQQPFAGLYYPEQTIPLTDTYWSRIEASVKGRDGFSVTKATCPPSVPTCYTFKGQRPLLILALSRSGSLKRLFGGLRQAFSEMSIKDVAELQLAPVLDRPLQLSLSAPKATLAAMKIPAASGQLFCAVPQNQQLKLSVLLKPAPSSTALEPSEPRGSGVEFTERPAWLHHEAGLTDPGDGAQHHELTILCMKPGFSLSGSSDIKGKLAVRYRVERRAVNGWWTQMNAENSWEYPYKIYKLSQVVKTIHDQALKKAVDKPASLDLTMRSQN